MELIVPIENAARFYAWITVINLAHNHFRRAPYYEKNRLGAIGIADIGF